MIDNGVLTEEHRVELIEGGVVEKMGRKPPHDAVVEQIQRGLLERLRGEPWRVRAQSAITTGDSEPEPDAVVTRATELDLYDRHPGPTEIVLVVDAVESSSWILDGRERGPIPVRDLLPHPPRQSP
jgi:hypothetical protein